MFLLFFWILKLVEDEINDWIVGGTLPFTCMLFCFLVIETIKLFEQRQLELVAVSNDTPFFSD